MSFGRRSNSSSLSYNPSQSSLNFLSPSTHSQIVQTQNTMAKLVKELNQTPKAESQRIESYQKMLFDKLRQAIDETSNLKFAETESNLAQRFGGSLNSTFGNDLLGRIEKERLGAIEDAKLDAAFTGNQLAENSNMYRLNKLQALQSYFSNMSSTLRDTNYMREMLLRQSKQDSPERRSRFMDILSKTTGFIIPFLK